MNYLKLKCVTAVFKSEAEVVEKRFQSRSTTVRPAEFDYYVVDGDDPKVGDLIVTSVNWGATDLEDEVTRTEIEECFNNAKFARVVKVHKTPTPKAKKFYLKLISRSELLESHKANRALLLRMTEAEEARAQLEEMLAQQDNTARYQQLAKSNPEAAKLLKKLNIKEE